MDLSLTRIDLLNVDTTSRKCLRILPLGKKNPGKTQKVVVGDQAGAVKCFGMKKGDATVVFAAGMERGVARVELGGTIEERDKIFVAAGQTIKAWSRKGREFLKFNTNLSEDIHSMHVLNDDIFTGGEYIYNQFRSCKDLHFMVANDRINDLSAVFSSPGATEPQAVLACQDRFVRVIQGGDVLFEGAVDGPVTSVETHLSSTATVSSALAHFNNLDADGSIEALRRPEKAKQPVAELVYGTENGIFGLLQLDDAHMRRGWEVGSRTIGGLKAGGADAGQRRGAGVTALASHDITHDGVNDIVVGRDDGSVQVFSFDVSREPKLVFQTQLSGSITSAEAGLVNSPNFDEVVVSTYSGHVVSFSSEPSTQIDLTGEDGGGGTPAQQADEEADAGVGALRGFLKGRRSSDSTAANPPLASGLTAAVASSAADKKNALEKRLRAVRKDIEALEQKLEQEKQKYQREYSEQLIAVQSDVKLRDTFALSEDEACYRLSVELSKPLEFVLLQSDVPMEVLDSARPEAGEDAASLHDRGAAIVSRTKTSASNSLLGTYRVTDNSTRVEVRLRTIEGRYGSLQAYVVPKGQPKTAQSATYHIKPLSLHRRLPTEPEAWAGRPVCELRITGTFSLTELHSWVCLALPEVPERVTTEEVTYFFQSTFLGTLLQCSYRKGDATFRSDNLTTLTTLKEVVGREATQRKVQLKTSYDVKEEAITAMLKIIDPLISYQRSLTQKVNLIDTLREVQQQENDSAFLDPSYVEILENADRIRAEHAQMPRQLDYLVGIVIDLYADKYKFKGVNVQQRLPLLDRLLRTAYSYDALQQFFGDI